jgi:hypothetical protein
MGATGVFPALEAAVARLDDVVRGLEPQVFDASGAARLVDVFARGERLCAAGKALAARRVDETGAWREDDARSGAHWLAARSGGTVGDAERSLRTACALDELPATQAAFRAGELSTAQASEIAETASGAPGTEADLLATATEASMKVLRDECRRVRAESVADDAVWAARLHASRRLDRWKDPTGSAAATGSCRPRSAHGSTGRSTTRSRCSSAPHARKAGASRAPRTQPTRS